MASPRRTTGSLYPTFVPGRLVCLTVKHPYAIALRARLPFVLRVPWEASVTLLEATTPVKLPTIQCPRFCGLELKQPKGHRSKDKRYSGDNRLIAPKSSYRRSGLAPRCRLVTSWGWRRSQGFGCSPIKVARELGSERRETVRSLSVAGVGRLRGPDFSTRGPSWTNLRCIGYAAKCTAE